MQMSVYSQDQISNACGAPRTPDDDSMRSMDFSTTATSDVLEDLILEATGMAVWSVYLKESGRKSSVGRVCLV